MNTTKQITGQFIATYIDEAIKKLIEDRYDVFKKQFIEQLEKDKAADLAGITLYVMKQVNINTCNKPCTNVITARKR